MDIEILYVCRESCTLFLADAPNAKMLQRHHDEIDKLKSLPPNDHAEFISKLHLIVASFDFCEFILFQR